MPRGVLAMVLCLILVRLRALIVAVSVAMAQFGPRVLSNVVAGAVVGSLYDLVKLVLCLAFLPGVL